MDEFTMNHHLRNLGELEIKNLAAGRSVLTVRGSFEVKIRVR